MDGLGNQELSVAYKVNRNEYVDIVYEGNKFTAYPVVVQKTDSVSNNSSVLVGTAKGVKTAYDKGVEALNKANQAQATADKKEDRFNKKSGFNLDKSDSVTSNSSSTLATSAAVKSAYDKGVNAERIANTKEPAFSKKSGFNLDKSDSVTSNSSSTIATSLAVKTAYDKANQAQSSADKAQSTADGKVSKSGDTVTGPLVINTQEGNQIQIYRQGAKKGEIVGSSNYIGIYTSGNGFTHKFMSDGTVEIQDKSLTTQSKLYTGAINELNSKYKEIRIYSYTFNRGLKNEERVRINFEKVFKNIPEVMLGMHRGVVGGSRGAEGADIINIDRSGFTFFSGWEELQSGTTIKYLVIASE